MRNKYMYILIGFLVSFSFMTSVFAEDEIEFEVYADASSTEVVVGTDVSVMVGIKSNVYINTCTFEVLIDDGIEALEPKGANGYNVSVEDGKYRIVNDTSTSGEAPVDGINILQLNYKINKDGQITIKTASCSSLENENDLSYDDKVIKFTTKEKSEDNSLKGIKINGEDIHNFSSDGNSYSVKIEDSKFSLSWETTNPDFQNNVVVKMNGVVISKFDDITWSDPTNQGIAELELVVNDKKTYSIGIRYEKKNLDNTLKSLKINGEEVNLDAGKTSYSIKVPASITSVMVEALLNDSENFKLDDTFVNGIKTHSFSGNSTKFTIEIIPVSDQTGAVSISYIIEVTKEGSDFVPPSSSTPTDSKPVTGEVEKNPQTGDISMFVMALILISSLVGSVLLYQKNMEAYK